MRAVLSGILRALGVEREMKAPELGRSISKEELMQEAKGFIAIVDRENRKAKIWLCLKAVMMNESVQNAYSPIEVTELGIVTDVSPLQPENAPSAMPRVPSLMVIEVLSCIVPLYSYATLPA